MILQSLIGSGFFVFYGLYSSVVQLQKKGGAAYEGSTEEAD